MSIGTYAQLTTALQDWSKRPDLPAYMADFVTLGEARINRDLRLRRQVTNTTLTTVSGTQGVTLPTDWLETENLTISSSSPPRMVAILTPEQMDRSFPAGVWTGTPEYAAVVGNTLQFGPTPDAAYSVSLDYYAKWAIATSLTNWLLTNHPGVYLTAAMIELCMYTFDDDRLTVWESKYRSEKDALQFADDSAIRSGSSLRVRAM